MDDDAVIQDEAALAQGADEPGDAVGQDLAGEASQEDLADTEAETLESSESGSGKLVLVRGGAESEIEFAFTAPAVIGRFDAAVGPVDVDLGEIDEGKYVSRKHARITHEDGVWSIEDLGSSNGTYVLRGDFEKVALSEIADGDHIALGNARFVFRANP